MSNDYASLSDSQLDAAYGASFDAGDHIAMNAYGQEIITREQTPLAFAGSLWDKVFGSPRFPIYESKIGQIPPTPGLLPQNTPAAPGFNAGNEALQSVQESANAVVADFKIAGFTFGGIALILLVIIILVRFGGR